MSSESAIAEALQPRPNPSLWTIFTTWLAIGIQSFGGGSATFFLIHQTCMQRSWISEDDFARSWALAQISPGINLVKITVIIGHRLRGWPGALMAMGGLLAPSAIVTALMTAFFAVVQDQPLVKAAMRGMAPAAVGLSLVMSTKIGAPVLKRAYGEGWGRLGIHILILVSALLAMTENLLSPVTILFLSGAFAILSLAAAPIPKEKNS